MTEPEHARASRTHATEPGHMPLPHILVSLLRGVPHSGRSAPDSGHDPIKLGLRPLTPLRPL